MSRFRSGLLLAAAIVVAPAAASAQAIPSTVLVGDLQSVCMAGGGDGVAAIAAADKAGWSPVPDAMLTKLTSQFEGAKGRMKSTSAGIELLMVGAQRKVLGATAMKVSVCAVAGGVADPPAVLTAMQSIAGPIAAQTGGASAAKIWAYDDGPDGHRAVDPDNASVKALLQSGRLRLLMAGTIPNANLPNGLTLIGYAVPTR